MDVTQWKHFYISHGSITGIRIDADGYVQLATLNDSGFMPTNYTNTKNVP